MSDYRSDLAHPDTRATVRSLRTQLTAASVVLSRQLRTLPVADRVQAAAALDLINDLVEDLR